MDPATIALAVKALDIAFVIGTYYMRRVDTHAELDELVVVIDEIRTIKGKLDAGEMDAAEGKRRLDALMATALKPMRDAIARL